MNDYAVIDAETSLLRDGEFPKTKFWGYADSERYEYFPTSAKLMKFLHRQSPKVLLHHSNFDVIQLLLDGVKGIHILNSHNNRLIRCAWEHHKLLNSYSVFPVGLKSIFNAFGFEKTDLGQLRKRNYEDCVNGLKCFLELDQLFFELVGVSPLSKGTIAGTGFAACEKVAGKMPKDLRFLDSYRGGRVECYDLRRSENVCKLDISSSYPRSFVETPNQSVLMRVRVKTKDWFCPLFDANNSEMLLFPNGSFTSWVYADVWEKYIEPNCERTSIKPISKHKIDLSWITRLHDFISDVYEKKNSSTGGIKLCCKLLLNASYGRIGLKGESERARIMDYIPDGDDITVHRLSKRQFLVFDKIAREPRSNFAFAAYITDNARGRLFESFVRNRALYGDTDSIFTPVAKSKFNGKLGHGLGEWNFEGKGWFKAHNVKDYEHECYRCQKKRDTKCPECDGNRIVAVRKGGEDFHVWTLKRFAAGKTVSSVHRTRQSELRKRLVLPDGTTEPLIVKQ